MAIDEPRTSAALSPPQWQVPRLRAEGRLLGGVAAGIADELGADPLYVRVAFVLLTIAGGVGAFLYVGVWAWLSWREHSDLEPYQPVPKGASAAHRHIAISLITLGVMLGIRAFGLGFADSLVWPSGLAAAGLLVAWHQGKFDLSAPATTKAAFARIAAGLILAAVGFTAMATLGIGLDLRAARDTALALTVITAGLLLVLGPWLWRIFGQLTEERRRRIRSEERAEVAAHLHDSVLQTLNLIQRNADQPHTTARLARRQERELRTWLYGGVTSRSGDRLRGALEALAAEVEDLHDVSVEVVSVGDCAVDDAVASLLSATREATLNAARHSGSDQVDVYAEVQPDCLEVFVRDTGRGFDPAAVPADRLGVAESIEGRMTRSGGTATIQSALGDGTEVELRLPRTVPVEEEEE